MLRLNRMKRQGRCAWMNPRSARLNSVADTPVMNARLFMAPISPRAAPGSRKRPLIPLDDALRPAGRLEVTTKLRRLIHGGERTGKCPVIHALFAEIDALHQRRVRAEYAWILALQRPVRRLGGTFVLLRRDLHQIAATAHGGAPPRRGRPPGGGRGPARGLPSRGRWRRAAGAAHRR